MRSPRSALAIAAVAIAVAAGTGGRVLNASASTDAVHPRYPTTQDCLKVAHSQVKVKGKLTVATDSPAQAPWFVGGSPSTGKGYESAVAYRVATVLGFKRSQVAWFSEPYSASTTAGSKPFDFDINEIAYSRALTTRVTFSISYFNLNQSAVSLKGARIVTHHTPAQLRTYTYAVQSGSASVRFVHDQVKPTVAPLRAKTLVEALGLLQAHRVDAIIVDTPEGRVLAKTAGLTQFAQFHTSGAYYALVSQKGSALVACLNTALRQMSHAGTLAKFSREYLGVFNAVPFIKP